MIHPKFELALPSLQGDMFEFFKNMRCDNHLHHAPNISPPLLSLNQPTLEDTQCSQAILLTKFFYIRVF